MKKGLMIMIVLLLMSSIALANPVSESKSSVASNAAYQETCSSVGGCNESDRDVKPGKVELIQQTWNYTDPDDGGDGILTLEQTERFSTNEGQITSAVKSEKKPEFKAGAELSKKISSANTGDLDGDGRADILISVEKTDSEIIVLGGDIYNDIKRGNLRTQKPMNKAELIELIASKAEIDRTKAEKILDTFINSVTDAQK